MSSSASSADSPAKRALPVVRDRLRRPLRDLRISVTDRCNFRCGYCMPRSHFGANFRFLPRAELLSFEEITRLARIFVDHGVTKIRLTGGEPLLRSQIEKLVAALASIPGVEIALTTNGSLLAEHARKLADAGLKRVTVSLDALDQELFRRMTDADFPVACVLDGIDRAAAAGLTPVKINAVIRRGINDSGIVELARHFKGTDHIVRFIEYMDVGSTNGWRRRDVVSGSEIVARIAAELPIEPVPPSQPGEVARRWRYLDGTGEIGVITSVSEPFCGDCVRARLSADGKLYTCLFTGIGTDLRESLRGGAGDDALRRIVAGIWSAREDRYSEQRSTEARMHRRIEMSYIGG